MTCHMRIKMKRKATLANGFLRKASLIITANFLSLSFPCSYNLEERPLYFTSSLPSPFAQLPLNPKPNFKVWNIMQQLVVFSFFLLYDHIEEECHLINTANPTF